jgi:rubrerythrin
MRDDHVESRWPAHICSTCRDILVERNAEGDENNGEGDANGRPGSSNDPVAGIRPLPNLRGGAINSGGGTLAIRFKTERRYITDDADNAEAMTWKDFRKYHAECITAWIRQNVGEEALKDVTKILGFEEQAGAEGSKTIVTGLVIVEKRSYNKIINRSGCDAERLWYCEPLQWSEPAIQSRVTVEWVSREEGEHPRQYAVRIAGMAGARGVAYGHRQLGIRHTLSERPQGSKAKRWRVTGVPSDWPASTVTEKLTLAGLTEIEGPVFSWKGPNETTTWIYRAIADGEEDYFDITAGEYNIVAVAEIIKHQPRQYAGAGARPLPNLRGGAWGKNSGGGASATQRKRQEKEAMVQVMAAMMQFMQTIQGGGEITDAMPAMMSAMQAMQKLAGGQPENKKQEQTWTEPWYDEQAWDDTWWEPEPTWNSRTSRRWGKHSKKAWTHQEQEDDWQQAPAQHAEPPEKPKPQQPKQKPQPKSQPQRKVIDLNVVEQMAKARREEEQEKITETASSFEGWKIREKDWVTPKAEGVTHANPKIVCIDDIEVTVVDEKLLRAITVCENQEQEDRIKDIIKDNLDDDADVAWTVLRMIPRTYRPSKDDTVINVAGMMASKMRSRRAILIKLGKTGAAPCLKKVQVQVTAPAEVTTLAIRFKTERRYITEDAKNTEAMTWKDFTKNHAECITAWIRQNVGEDALKDVTRILGFEEQAGAEGGKAIVTGLVIVEKRSYNKIINKSGCDAKRLWFCEPLQWSEPAIQSRVTVEWVDREKGEYSRQYAVRVAGIAGTRGVACGHRQLGIRYTLGERPQENRARKWRVTGVPSKWPASTVTEKLTLAGLTEIEGPNFSRKGPNGTTTWFYRAVAAEEEDYFDIAAGEHNIEVFAEIIKHQPRQYATTLRSVSINRGPTSEDVAKKKVQQKLLTQPKRGADAARLGKEQNGVDKTIIINNEEQNEDTKMTDKDAEATSGTKPKVRKVEQPYVEGLPTGAEEILTRTNGECMFDCVAKLLQKEDAAAKHNHISVRRLCVEHLGQNWKESKWDTKTYETLWDGKKPQKADEECADHKTYLKILSTNKAWGGALELLAMTRVYKRSILVVQNDMQCIRFGERFAADGTKTLVLRYDGSHYVGWFFHAVVDFKNFIKKVDGHLPVIHGETAVSALRGGANGLQDPGTSVQEKVLDASHRPARSWTGDSLCSQRPKGRYKGSEAEHITGRSSKNHNATCSGISLDYEYEGSALANASIAGDDLDEIIADIEAEKIAKQEEIDKIKEEKKQARGKWLTEKGEWKCPICPSWSTGYTIYWRQKKYDHVGAWHPEERQSLNLRDHINVPKVEKIGLNEEATWRCPACDHGIKEARPNSIPARMARLAHWEKAHRRMNKKKFLLRKQDTCRTTEANAITRAAGAVRRIQKGKQSQHAWTTFRWGFGPRKNRRDIICTACTRVTRSIPMLDKCKCVPIVPGELGWQKREAFIEKCKKGVEEASTPQDKADAERLLSMLRAPVLAGLKSQRMKQGIHPEGSVFTALKVGKFGTLRFFCEKCKRAAGNQPQLQKQPCRKLDKEDYGYVNRVNFLKRMRQKSKKNADEFVALCNLDVEASEVKEAMKKTRKAASSVSGKKGADKRQK